MTKWNRKFKRYNLTGLYSNCFNAQCYGTPFTGERNDCVVQSISFAANIPYHKVRKALFKVHPSHKPNSGWSARQYIEALANLRIDFVYENRHETVDRTTRYDSWRSHASTTSVTVGETLAHFLDNEGATESWLVRTNKHLIGIVNGVPHHCLTIVKPGWGRKQRIRQVYLLNG